MIRTLLCFTVTLALISVIGCDPKAKANANDNPVVTGDRMSKAYESCAKTSDCVGDLRCFEHVCRSDKASVIGDYHAAVGALHLASDKIEGAIKAYTAAVNRYESDKLPTPLAVLCGKGRALTAARDEREVAEKAAASLHECLRLAPVGSPVRQQALDDLAKLGAVGLDPELLARDKTQTDYLTKEAAGPSSSKIQVATTSAVKTRAKSYPAFIDLLQSPPTRDQMLPCWEANYKATKQKNLSVTFTFRYRFYEGEFEADDRDKLTIKSAAPGAGPAKCIYDVVAPMADEFSKAQKRGGRWDGDITLTMQ